MLALMSLIHLISVNVLADDRCSPSAARLVSMEGEVVWKPTDDSDWIKASIGSQFCHGDIIRVTEHRAALRLANNSVVRLKENTTLKLESKEQSLWVKLIQGISHFMVRSNESFFVQGNRLNASVDGTEFVVSAEEQAHKVAVLEGQVTASNNQGSVVLTAGQQTQVTGPQSAPSAATTVSINDAVTWALHFPPVILVKDDSAQLSQAFIGLIQSGDYRNALQELRDRKDVAESASLSQLQASLELYYGHVASAQSLITQALTLAPENSSAQAIQTLLQVIQGHLKPELALSNNTLALNDPISLLTQSYIQQANFDLEGAYKSTEQAASYLPNNALIATRQAELALNLGNTRQADTYITQVLKLSPKLSRAYTIKGFVLLKQLKIKQAKANFEQALTYDNTSPLAQFAYGLTHIRQGEFDTGRERIELAVMLDPSNSLFRSYLGKVYLEEHRHDLSNTQFDLAAQLDSNDPTPFFYSALQYQVLNQPSKALEQAKKSIEKNNNRAVYRSRLMLADDNAARNTTLGTIYKDLALNEQARLHASKTLTTHPNEFGAHKLLAETLENEPSFDSARSSEILQAQLNQPLTSRPVNAIEGETNLRVLSGTGPQELSSSEFNSLFNSNDVQLNTSLISGSNSTQAAYTTLSGLANNTSFAWENYYYTTDGFWDNGDLTYNINNFFVQTALSESLNIIANVKGRREDYGNLTGQFNPSNPVLDNRTTVDEDSARLGFSFNPNKPFQLLGFLERVERTGINQNNIRVVQQPPIPMAPPLVIEIEEELTIDDSAENIELQISGNLSNITAITGLYYSHINRSEKRENLTTVFPPLPPGAPPLPPPEPELTTLSDTGRVDYTNLYSYWHTPLTTGLNATVGFSYIEMKDNVTINTNINELQPKLGLTWNKNHMNAGIAAFKNVTRELIQTQSVEPTQIAGISQIKDFPVGSEVDTLAAKVDYTFQSNISIGVLADYRKIDLPSANNSGTSKDRNVNQDSLSFYIQRSLGKWSLSLSGEAEIFESPDTERSEGVSDLQTLFPRKLETLSLPVNIRYQFKQSIALTLIATYVNQESIFDNLNNIDTETKDESFWYSELQIKYTLPNSLGALSLEIKNLGDENFIFQNGNFLDPTPELMPYIPERTALIKASIKF